MKTKDEFKREFFDLFLGMCVRTTPSNDEAARGLFIRERQQRVGEVLERIYAYLTDETKPTMLPAKNGQPVRKQ